MRLGCTTLAATSGNGARIGTARIILKSWRQLALRAIRKGHQIASIRKNLEFPSAFRKAVRLCAAINTVPGTTLAAVAKAQPTAAVRTLGFVV